MSRSRRNVPNPGYFKVGGSSVEDRDIARRAKGALGREAARRRSRAGMKTTLGEAPPEQHAHELPGQPAATRARAQKTTTAKTAEKATHTAQRAAHKATQTAQRATQTAAQTAQRATQTAQKTAHKAQRKARAATENAIEKVTREVREHVPEQLLAPVGPVRRAARRLWHIAEVPVERARAGLEAPGGGRVRRATRSLVHAAEEAMSFGRAMVDYWRNRNE